MNINFGTWSFSSIAQKRELLPLFWYLERNKELQDWEVSLPIRLTYYYWLLVSCGKIHCLNKEIVSEKRKENSN